MEAQGTKSTKEARELKKQTPTFLLALPLVVDAAQAKRLRAHLEAGRQFYNALLSLGQRRLHQMRADSAWQAARATPRSKPQERRVRFKSRGRGLSSIENKRDDTGLRFVLRKSGEGYQGVLIWKQDQIRALIDGKDPIVSYGLAHRIKYARLLRRPVSSPNAQGADCQGYRYFVQLALEGIPYHKPKHTVGADTIGLDLGPSSIAIVPQQGEARLEILAGELVPDEKAIRRLQRKMDRQRRAANPEHYDEQGRPKKRGKQGLHWKQSKSYQATRRRKATKERKLKAHRKCVHGRMVHEIVVLGKTICTEKLSYQGWQKRYGTSVGLRAPGMFIDHLRRTVASTGGTLIEVPTRTTKLSQFCHGCGAQVKKPLSQRWHECACGIGPIQRDLYAAFLAAYLETADALPSCALYAVHWEGAEARLRAAQERPCTLYTGKVRRRACGQHKSESTNARKRGRSCPEALASLEPERVCPKV